jgi:trigger factor
VNEGEMKTSVEDLGPVKKKLHIEIESGAVDRKLDKAYREMSKKAKIPGFRPGKAPRGILERYYGKQVVEDVTKDLISETFPEALKELQTTPLGLPLVEKEALKQGEAFKYSAVMEVRPQFELKDYLGMEVDKEKWSLTDEDVENRLEQIRKANGKLVPVEEDRPVKEDDYAVINYQAFEDGSPIDAKSENFLLKVGSHDFHPKFEEGLVGLKKEEEAEIEVDFEDDFYQKKLAGKSILFKVRVLDIKRMTLPELDDDFARSLGADFNDLEAMKSKVRESMSSQEEKRTDRELKQRLIEKISEGLDFEIPKVLVDAEIDYAVENVRQNVIRSGSSLEKAGIAEEKLREEFAPASRKRVKEMLILGEIARQNDITVDEEDLSQGYGEVAAETGQDPDIIKKYYEARELVGSLEEKLLERKTLNYLIEHAKVNEVEKDALIKKNGAEKEKE